MSIASVCVMGIVTVFIGLICLIFITNIMSAICRKTSKPEPVQSPAKPAPSQKAAPIANKQEIIAGVCAVIAEELGTDVSNIKVTSFKKL